MRTRQCSSEQVFTLIRFTSMSGILLQYISGNCQTFSILFLFVETLFERMKNRTEKCFKRTTSFLNWLFSRVCNCWPGSWFGWAGGGMVACILNNKREIFRTIIFRKKNDIFVHETISANCRNRLNYDNIKMKSSDERTGKK